MTRSLLAETFRSAANAAVDRAMERAHRNNPAGWHSRRPGQLVCRFDEDCPFVNR